jgi:hypothetical protein
MSLYSNPKRLILERLASCSGQLYPPSSKADCSSDRNAVQHWPQNLRRVSRVLNCVIRYGWRVAAEVASCWTATEDQFLRHHWHRSFHRPYLLNSSSATKRLISRWVPKLHQGLAKQEICFEYWHRQRLLSSKWCPDVPRGPNILPPCRTVLTGHSNPSLTASWSRSSLQLLQLCQTGLLLDAITPRDKLHCQINYRTWFIGL